MADEIELKNATPDATVNSAAVLIGADTPSSAAPSLFQISAIWAHLRSLANTWSGAQTFTSSVSFTQVPTVGGNAIITEATDVTLNGTQTLTNKTLTSPVINSPVFGAGSIDSINEIAAGLRTGSSSTLVTGSSGANSHLAQWDANGNLATAGKAAPSGTIVGTNDAQTITNKTIDLASNIIIGARELLTSNRTYYVRMNGSDSNDGLANTAGGAFLTVQHAVNTALGLDMGIYNVTISIAGGTYTEAINVQGNGNARLTISGAGENTVIGPASGQGVSANGTVDLTLRDVRVRGSSHLIRVEYGATVRLRGTVGFSVPGESSSTHMLVEGGVVDIAGGAVLNLNADTGTHLHCRSSGSVFVSTSSLVVTTPITVSGQVVLVQRTATVTYATNAAVWSGSAITGKRFTATVLGAINVFGAATTYIPGSVEGTTDAGGVYA